MVFLHGFGGSRDLPIPLAYAIAGAVAALAISFTVLAVAWRTRRFDSAVGGLAIPATFTRIIDGATFAWTLRGVGLAIAAYVGWAAVSGPDLLINPVFGFVYVLLWVGIVAVSVLFGPVYRALNPIRTLHLLLTKLTGGDPATGVVALPRWIGLWPATLGLLSFVWMELVYPDATYLSPLRFWFAVYLAVVLVGAALFGDKWIERADPFEAYSTLVGRLSVFGRRADGTLVLRNPLTNLDATPASPGLVALVAVLFGSTAFDSFKDSSVWLNFAQSSTIDSVVLNTLGLVGLCALIGLLFAGSTLLTGVHDGQSRWLLPDRFAHAVVPIVVGYVTAHYLSYLLETGQQTLIQLSDPMGTGANYLGTADWQVHYFLSTHPTLLATIKISAVVIGHLVGVIASHDRAVQLLPKRHQLTGQLPLLLVMVGYTVGGIWLLFSA